MVVLIAVTFLAATPEVKVKFVHINDYTVSSYNAESQGGIFIDRVHKFKQKVESIRK